MSTEDISRAFAADQARVDEDARPEVQSRIRAVIEHTAVALYRAERVDRPIRGFSWVATDVEALAGMRAAIHVRDHAIGRLHEYARQARADGATWEQIGELLGIEREDGYSRGEAAFRHLVEDEPLPGRERGTWRAFHPYSTSWRCGSCTDLVTDRGPFEGHPDDNETGHAPGCERHGREIAAFERARDSW